MKATKLILQSTAFIALVVPTAFAQQSGTSSNTLGTTTNPPTIKQRKENQQDRIANGMQDGQLRPEKPRTSRTRKRASTGRAQHACGR